MNLELMGNIETNTINKCETRNRRADYWSMQLGRRKGKKSNFRTRRNGWSINQV